MNYYFLKFINTRLTDYKFILPITSLAFSGSIYSFYLNYNKFILNYLNPERKFFKKSGIKKKEIY